MARRKLSCAIFTAFILLFAYGACWAASVTYIFEDDLSECQSWQCVNSIITGYIEIDNPQPGVITDWEDVVDYEFYVDTIYWNKTESQEGSPFSLQIRPDSLDRLFIENFFSTNSYGYQLTVENYGSFIVPGLLVAASDPEIGIAQTNPVPEPATLFLLGTGFVALAGARRKFKK